MLHWGKLELKSENHVKTEKVFICIKTILSFFFLIPLSEDVFFQSSLGFLSTIFNFLPELLACKIIFLLLLLASPYSGSPQSDSNLHFTRSTLSPFLAPTLSMSSLTKSIHLFLGLPLFLLPGTAISIILSPRSLLSSFLHVHTNIASHSKVCLPALQFLQSLSCIHFLSCPFLSLPVPISPFSTLQLPFFPFVFQSLPLFP